MITLLGSRAHLGAPELITRAGHLLRRNTEARRQAEAATTELAIHDIRFPGLARHPEQLERGGRLAETIRQRGSVFALVS